MATLVPPIKCQGIKTKLVPALKQVVPSSDALIGRWIEPFCGSLSVALNVEPIRALLSDNNIHIIRFYQAIQAGEISSASVRAHLEMEDKFLREMGQQHYNEVRKRFNQEKNPLDFLFLNRSCFNGVMRFNRHGHFNVPFCHKPERFAQSYVTKITNQVRAVEDVLRCHHWNFAAVDFRVTLSQATAEDFVYLDPPYFGRHVDYFNSWTEEDEGDLNEWLCKTPCRWALSTWYSNQYRTNESAQHWETLGYAIRKIEHFYHVGSTEELRHPMIEAVITNVKIKDEACNDLEKPDTQLELVFKM